MGKIGKISPIPKDVSNAFPTMDTSLRQRGLTRYPGTTRMMYPYRELNNKWRTGLDPNASYIRALKEKNPVAGEAEEKRVAELKKQLEAALDIDLSPNSDYWKDVAPVRISDGENLFDLENPARALEFAWLRVHPSIAPSLRAWEAGEVDSSLTLYVKDDNAEAEQNYRKIKAVYDAVAKFTSFSLEKRMKIARLMGLPLSGDETEAIVFAEFDKVIRAVEMSYGPYKGSSPVRIFERYATLPDEQVEAFNLVELSLRNNIYRTGVGGKIFQGETVVFNSKEDMQTFYLDEKNQDQLRLLKKQVNTQKEVFS